MDLGVVVFAVVGCKLVSISRWDCCKFSTGLLKSAGGRAGAKLSGASSTRHSLQQRGEMEIFFATHLPLPPITLYCLRSSHRRGEHHPYHHADHACVESQHPGSELLVNTPLAVPACSTDGTYTDSSRT